MSGPARPSLPELQRWMRWVLTHPDGPAAATARPPGRARLPRRWTRGPEPRRLLATIGQTGDLSREERLAIYGSGYFLRIIGVMAANYPSLRNAVGEHAFDHHIARDYLVCHPSVHKCIDNVGDRMSDFLSRDARTRGRPWLADLARLEWAFHESFYADDVPLLDPDSIRSVPATRWENARVALDPSVRLLELGHPVVGLWKDDGHWPARRQAAIRRGDAFVAVYREPDGRVRVMELSREAFELLSDLAAGRRFGSAVERAAKRGLPAGRVSALFRRWSESGVIRRVNFT